VGRAVDPEAGGTAFLATVTGAPSNSKRKHLDADGELCSAFLDSSRDAFHRKEFFGDRQRAANLGIREKDEASLRPTLNPYELRAQRLEDCLVIIHLNTLRSSRGPVTTGFAVFS